MASFPAKISWNWPRKRENKNYRSVSTRRVIENSKKIAKKFKKLKHTIMASLQAKTGSKRQRKREKKITVSFCHTRHVIENSRKIAKKIRKLKNTITTSFQEKIGWKRPRKREN